MSTLPTPEEQSDLALLPGTDPSLPQCGSQLPKRASARSLSGDTGQGPAKLRSVPHAQPGPNQSLEPSPGTLPGSALPGSALPGSALPGLVESFAGDLDPQQSTVETVLGGRPSASLITVTSALPAAAGLPAPQPLLDRAESAPKQKAKPRPAYQRQSSSQQPSLQSADQSQPEPLSARRTSQRSPDTDQGPTKLGPFTLPDIGPAAVSLCVHLLLMVIMGLITFSLPARRPEPNLVAVAERPEEPLIAESFEVDVVATEDPGAQGDSGIELAGASASEMAEFLELPAPTVDESADLLSETSLQVPQAPTYHEKVATRGPVAAATSGSFGAVDQITGEILRTLEQSPVLVVWFFDQSGSLDKQRESIRARFGRVYAELSKVEKSGQDRFTKHGKEPLLTSVIAFGNGFQFMTRQPTSDLAEIQESVANISTDDTGVENVFTAVIEATQKLDSYRRGKQKRQLMFVVFSDERGDDAQLLETALDRCRQREIPVYVVGVPAPFGKQQALIKYDYPDPRHGSDWLPVDQGPESCLPELVNLTFRGQAGGDPVDSGFGPYALSRLCKETGGKYFANHPGRPKTKPRLTDDKPDATEEETTGAQADVASRLAKFFDPELMTRYQPDYYPPQRYQQLVESNRAMSGLVAASLWDAQNPLPALERPRLSFPFIDQANFARLMAEAQNAYAKLDHSVNRLYELLAAGEKDRPLLDRPRWQASYDLAMGRVLALKVRTEGYNAMLAQAKSGMSFTQADSDTWQLRPADTISVGSAAEKMAKQAKDYLQRVVTNHPGTPWAYYAQMELAEPLGWEWVEAHTGVNAPPPGAAGNAPPPPPMNDMARKAPPPPPKPPAPKL